MVSQLDADKLQRHLFHNVEITHYADHVDEDGTIVVINIALECNDCSEVLADADALPETTK